MNSIVNVQEILGPKKHKAIIEKIIAIGEGDSITLLNDHDPKPLLTALDQTHPFTFKYEYLESKTGIYKVTIYRAKGMSDFDLSEIASKDLDIAIKKVSNLELRGEVHYPLNFRYWPENLWKSFIEYNHHDYEIETSAELIPIINKVVQAHHNEIPELWDIQSVFSQLVKDIEMHCAEQKERFISEQVHTINKELRHLMARLNDLTYGFASPPDSCPLTVTFYQRLKELCSDINYHLFVEDYLLPHAAK